MTDWTMRVFFSTHDDIVHLIADLDDGNARGHIRTDLEAGQSAFGFTFAELHAAGGGWIESVDGQARIVTHQEARARGLIRS